MNELQFSTAIHAPRHTVWNTLWQDATFRDWAGLIDPGTYMVGELKEGNEVQCLSAENGYGVTSLVEQLVPGEFLVLRHTADTQDTGAREREKEWTGSTERYSLTEDDGLTTLTITFDIPPSQEAYFKATYPKALERIKALAEKTV